MSESAAEKFAARLFARGAVNESVRESFLAALKRRDLGRTALIWLKPPVTSRFNLDPSPEFLPDFIQVVSSGERPGADELHESGAYYCLDLSSVVLSSSQRHLRNINNILDLCSSPGGKSIFAARSLRPELLVSNESVRNRAGALISNLKRCQIPGAIVTSSDSSYFASDFPSAFDLVIVDAPCSGQSLPLRGINAEGCFNPLVIKRNARRQRRILANGAQSVTHGGYLLYLTCTYSYEENEENLLWLLKNFPEFTPVETPDLGFLQSPFTDFPCARLWPGMALGAGGFSVLLQRRSNGETPASPNFEMIRPLWKAGELAAIEEE